MAFLGGDRVWEDKVLLQEVDRGKGSALCGTQAPIFLSSRGTWGFGDGASGQHHFPGAQQGQDSSHHEEWG